MAEPYFAGDTLDDVMRDVIEAILVRGDRIIASKGATAELTGVLLEITNPRARLSRTETRGKPFSCLGELCWYLAKTNDLGFISYYVPRYKCSAEGDVIFGGYGPRLFASRGQDQVANVINLLRRKPTSRQAVIQLFNAEDIAKEHKDIPCTCSLQFMIRQDALHMVTYMRSNDAFLGLPHDVFCFTMLQELIARSLSVELGSYKHAVGSLHLYDSNRDDAQRFHNEGWQPTQMLMPPMPPDDPWPAIDILRVAEAAIRTKDAFDVSELEILDPYWLDIIRLLQVFRCLKDKDDEQMERLRGEMSFDVYHSFIDQKLRQLRATISSQPIDVDGSTN